ncbi:MAG: hypothetical protein WDN66_00185 [Candidatus Saccharibacteria bacterium]
MEWSPINVENNPADRYLIAQQILRGAEYRCLWQLLFLRASKELEIIGRTDRNDAIVAADLLGPSFNDYPLKSRWGDMEASVVEDVRRHISPVHVDSARPLPELLTAIAVNERQEEVVLVDAMQKLILMKNTMLEQYLIGGQS